MEKITGMEAAHEVPPKVLLIYEAVEKLIAESADINALCVAEITKRAGIGKGTVYDYFETKDEMIACSLLYHIKKLGMNIRSILNSEGTFEEHVNKLLDAMEKKDEKSKGFLRFVHVMTDNSRYCMLVRKKMQQEEFKPYLLLNIAEEYVRKQADRGVIKKQIPVEYAVYSFCTKLLTYMMAVSSRECRQTESTNIRPYICNSILNELCEKNMEF